MRYTDDLETYEAAQELSRITPCTSSQLEQLLNQLVMALQEGVSWKDIYNGLIIVRDTHARIRRESAHTNSNIKLHI